ncbi:hypothetical protein M0R45_035901 [Rubus argutus]|uniref:Uncharacterized protein n=1 Tax=Rubus argutus TaxID=59490 RepID=A0AAW1VY69_RUBAR
MGCGGCCDGVEAEGLCGVGLVRRRRRTGCFCRLATTAVAGSVWVLEMRHGDGLTVGLGIDVSRVRLRLGFVALGDG